MREVAQGCRAGNPHDMDPHGRSLLEACVMRALTAGAVISRMKTRLGIPWRDTTYRDTFKFGGPDTEVRGIATAMFCTFDVVKRAAEAGYNMILPHEDTYWNDRDDTSVVSSDPPYKTKVDFMREHTLVIFP